MMLLAQCDQFIACRERIRHFVGVLGDILMLIGKRRSPWGTLMDADHRILGGALPDKAAADGIPDLLVHQIVLMVERLKTHAVGMRGHAMPSVHHHVTRVIEPDAMRSGEGQTARTLARGADAVHVFRVHVLRGVAFKSRHHGPVGTMPESGQRQRAVQNRAHAGDPVEAAGLPQRNDESASGHHRSDGMRGTRSHADCEHVEHAEHTIAHLAKSRGCRNVSDTVSTTQRTYES